MSAAAPQAEAVGMSPAEWGDVYRRIALAWPEAIPWLQPGGAYYAVLGGLSHEQVVAALVAFDREDQRRPPAPAVLRARALAAGAQLAAARAAVAEPVGALMAARGLSTTQEQALERAHPGGGMGTAALVLGILGIAVPIICSLGAIIYGAAALRPAGEGQAERPRRGQAVAGLILGVMGFVTWVGIILIVALAQA